VPECPICRRTYDDRFKVFVPPHSEAYDTIECARASARSGAAAKEPFLPVILPTIEVVRPAPVAAASARRAGLGAGAFAPAQLALAGGVGLLAAGTAAAVYIAAKPPSKLDQGTTIAAGAGPTLPARPAVTPPAAQTSGAAGPTLRRVKQHEKSKATIRRPRPAVARVTPTLARAPSPALGSAQLASRIIPSSASSSVSPLPEATTAQQSANAGASPQPKPHRSPPAVHRSPRPKSPKPPTPAPPTPTTTTSTPPTPTPTTEPVVAAPTAEVASAATETAVAAKPRPDNKNHGQNPEPPPTPQPPPASPPPTAGPSQPPESDESGDDDHGSRPGHGWGDDNHDHTGPPGHDDRGESGSHSSDDEHGNCDGDGHGHGHGHDHDD
jgi:hypothetical protein